MTGSPGSRVQGVDGSCLKLIVGWYKGRTRYGLRPITVIVLQGLTLILILIDWDNTIGRHDKLKAGLRVQRIIPAGPQLVEVIVNIRRWVKA